MWKLEEENYYFKIYDSARQIAAYFDPDYGDIYPQEKELEVIERMHKDNEKISGGFLMVPMLKFGIFDIDFESDLTGLEKQLEAVNQRIARWKNFISEINNHAHFIRISHTDQDMLSITFPIKFSKPTSLEKKDLLEEIEPMLDLMHIQGLV